MVLALLNVVMTADKGQGQVSAVLGHQYDLRRQPRPGTSTWPLVVTWTTDMEIDPCRCMATDLDMGRDFSMTSGGSAGFSHKLFLTTFVFQF